MFFSRNSALSGAGEGLFAVRDLPAGTIAAFYNGVRLPYVLGGPKEIWETSGYKIYVNADFKSGERMDIPVPFSNLLEILSVSTGDNTLYFFALVP